MISASSIAKMQTSCLLKFSSACLWMVVSCGALSCAHDDTRSAPPPASASVAASRAASTTTPTSTSTVSAAAAHALLMAEVAASSGNDVLALDLLHQAIRADPHASHLRARRAELLLTLGQAQDALVDALACGEQKPSARCWWLQGVAHEALQHPAEAAAALQQAMVVGGDDVDCRRAGCPALRAHEALVGLLVRSDQVDAALRISEPMLVANGAAGLRVREQLVVGFIEHAMGNEALLTQADQQVRAWMAQDPDSHDAVREAVRLALLRGHDEEAWLLHKSQLTEDASDDVIRLGRTLWQRTERGRAESMAPSAAATSVDSLWALVRAGQVDRSIDEMLKWRREHANGDADLLAVGVAWAVARHRLADAKALACNHNHERMQAWCARLTRYESGLFRLPAQVMRLSPQMAAWWLADALAWHAASRSSPSSALSPAQTAQLDALAQRHAKNPDSAAAAWSWQAMREHPVTLPDGEQSVAWWWARADHVLQQHQANDMLAAARHLLSADNGPAAQNYFAYGVALEPALYAQAELLREALKSAWLLVVDDPLNAATLDTWGLLRMRAAANPQERTAACAVLARAHALREVDAEIMIHLAACLQPLNPSEAKRMHEQAMYITHPSSHERAVVHAFAAQSKLVQR
jgi:hypothetical protein